MSNLKPCQGCRRELDPTAKICPGCGRPDPTKTPMRKGIVALATLGIFAVCGIVCVSAAGDLAAGAKKAAAPAAENAAPAETPLDVTVRQLCRDYDANEVAADDKYKGHSLTVTGVVQSVDKDAFDKIVVHLRCSNQFLPAMAMMEKSATAGAAQLTKGQTVTFRCKGGTRIIGAPTLDGCWF